MSEVDFNIGKLHKFTGQNMPLFQNKVVLNGALYMVLNGAPYSFLRNGDIVVVLETHPNNFVKILTSDGIVANIPYRPHLWEEV